MVLLRRVLGASTAGSAAALAYGYVWVKDAVSHAVHQTVARSVRRSRWG